MKRNHMPLVIFLLGSVLMLALAGCSVRIQSGANQWELALGPTATPQATYTSNPTYTPRPSLTYLPSDTPFPTLTDRPFPTLLPTYTHGPTLTNLPPSKTATFGKTPTPGKLTPSATISTVIIIPTAGAGEISQFAASASASSQYSSSGYSASQATGAPNTPLCGDKSTAWASLNGNTKEWLVLNYTQAVTPTRIIIYQSYNPGAVALVEVMDAAGKWVEVYQAAPAVGSACPVKLEIAMKGLDFAVKAVRVTVDQTKHSGWAEIDAVQLVGKVK